MALAPIRLTGPRGQLVQGSPFRGQTTNQQGEPLVVKSGPNKGQPRTEFFIAVAYRKDKPETLPYIKQLVDHAAGCWPNFFPNGVNMSAPNFGCINPSFSFKIIDGDGYDDHGKPNSEKQGFAGCWVVRYSTGYAPGVWQEPNYGELDRITDERALPRGYFCRVNHTVDSNNSDQTAGIYVNLDKVAISADQHDAEVFVSGQSASDAFGGGSIPAIPTPAPAPAADGLHPVPGAAHSIEALRGAGWTDDQIVAGGYATRTAPAPLPASPPPAPAAPTPPASTPAAPTDPAPVTPSPSNPPAPAPYDGFMGGTTGQAPAAPVPPQTTARQMLPAAQGASYEALIKAGWTDEMLVQHGMMAS